MLLDCRSYAPDKSKCMGACPFDYLSTLCRFKFGISLILH